MTLPHPADIAAVQATHHMKHVMDDEGNWTLAPYVLWKDGKRLREKLVETAKEDRKNVTR